MRINPGRVLSVSNNSITLHAEKRINPELKDIIERMRDITKSEEGCSGRGPVLKVKPVRARNPEKEKRNALIQERYANGERVEKIAKDYHIDQSWIYLICKGVERKVKPVRAKDPETEKRDATIRKRYANGETPKAIGKDYGLTGQGISLICKGVERKVKPVRAKDPETEKRNALIRERYANGETQKAIGKDYGLTKQNISLVCKGVERKRKAVRAPRKKDLEIEKRNALIGERYANGETQKAIGKDYPLSQNMIYVICKGVKRKVKTEIEKRNDIIRERYANGETPKTIGKDYDLTHGMISRICKGVERKVKPVRVNLVRAPRKRNPEKEKRNAQIMERYANGETQKAIGKDYHLSKNQIYIICKGVERKVKPVRVNLVRAPRKRNPEKEKRNAQIMERYANGGTVTAITKDYDLTHGMISRICKGVERKGKTEIEKRNDQIRERYANGGTVTAITKDYDLAYIRISRICKGVERKGKTEIEKRNDQIRERYANGETQIAIGKDYSLSQVYICKICKGIERKGKSEKRESAKIAYPIEYMI